MQKFVVFIVLMLALFQASVQAKNADKPQMLGFAEHMNMHGSAFGGCMQPGARYNVATRSCS